MFHNKIPTVRLTASAVCFQLGLGYGVAELVDLNGTINTTWKHPIDKEEVAKNLTWLDAAEIDSAWVNVNPQGNPTGSNNATKAHDGLI
jgi:hypothetical protein